MMTDLGRLCRNFRIPSTNSCFDSSSAKILRSLFTEHTLNRLHPTYVLRLRNDQSRLLGTVVHAVHVNKVSIHQPQNLYLRHLLYQPEDLHRVQNLLWNLRFPPESQKHGKYLDDVDLKTTKISIMYKSIYPWLQPIIPYKLITRIQLRIINGISSQVTSRYSSSEPPNNFGWPVIFIRPIRFRFGTFVLTKVLLCTTESLANAFRNSSALASRRAIRDVPNMYSRIF